MFQTTKQTIYIYILLKNYEGHQRNISIIITVTDLEKDKFHWLGSVPENTLWRVFNSKKCQSCSCFPPFPTVPLNDNHQSLDPQSHFPISSDQAMQTGQVTRWDQACLGYASLWSLILREFSIFRKRSSGAEPSKMCFRRPAGSLDASMALTFTAFNCPIGPLYTCSRAESHEGLGQFQLKPEVPNLSQTRSGWSVHPIQKTC